MLNFNLNPDVDRAIQRWLNWQETICTDPSEAYTASNIEKVTMLFRNTVPSPFSMDEIHTLIRVYLDDELGYIDILYITQAGQIATALVCADMTWVPF